MNSTAALLDRVVSDLGPLVRADAAAGSSDAEKMDILRAAGEVQRLLDALVVETVASVDGRPEGPGEPSFPGRFGCRTMNELLQRALRVDASGAGRVVKAAKAVHRQAGITTGAPLPTLWPQLREALLDGVIGVPGLLAATGPIDQAGRRVGCEDRLRADAQLAAFARGCAVTDLATEAEVAGELVEVSGPPATPDDLRLFAQVIATYLDPDGAEPANEKAMRGRFLSFGREKDGGIPIHGSLLPDAAGRFQRLLDAYNNPKVDGPPAPDLGGVMFRSTDDDRIAGDDAEGGDAAAEQLDVAGLDDDVEPRPVSHDDRTPGQKRHDAFAAVLMIAARHDDVPTLGGAAPTLVVSVTADDFATGRGWAHVDGIDTPVPVSVAAHTACVGSVQRVLFDENGRIRGISTTDRIFTAHQRRAIALRDAECLIPGCHVRATWCEIHHVRDYALGGPTDTDNGVALCWFHHRTLDTSGWEIRMNAGLPEIRGPAWWDPERHWRRPQHAQRRGRSRTAPLRR
ncbi:HNH endonuclease signature motif containing protein [Microbacterium aurantiacum]|uniref:HNH endonuclease signature motif containing protein n=1 Tax=Microbacterium aurantiacum TaxID=162393 RepID=UPI0011AF054F|nr:HNH endonuclease signature motif containing protein [Microbacterium aurantiacum]